MASSSDPACLGLSSELSAFVDALVDHAFSGLFFPRSKPNPRPPPTRIEKAPSRLVAIGDLHGDLNKTLKTLFVAKLIDSNLRWTGGASVAVQVGDILDRGGRELDILYFIHHLKNRASAAGGAFHTLHGNHEVMNISLDFRFVTPDGLQEFSRWASCYRTGLAMKRLCLGLENQRDPFRGIPKSFTGIKEEYWDGFRSRIAALQPKGPISTRFLSGNQAVLVIGDSVFVHAGLREEHVAHGLERINNEVRDWVEGRRAAPPPHVIGMDSMVWTRRFSSEYCGGHCEELKKVLASIRGRRGVRRMVMGHTIQEEGINGACRFRAIRIDVGLSAGCGDHAPEVLEIDGTGRMTVLTGRGIGLPVALANEERIGLPVAVENEERKGSALLLHKTALKPVEKQDSGGIPLV